MTSPDAFFIFSKFWFSGLLGWGEGGQEGKGQKMIQNVKKILSHSVSPELYLIWLSFLVHMGKMISQKKLFFHFFKILIFWVFQSSSINAKRKFWDVPHLLHMSVIFCRNTSSKKVQIHHSNTVLNGKKAGFNMGKLKF